MKTVWTASRSFVNLFHSFFVVTNADLFVIRLSEEPHQSFDAFARSTVRGHTAYHIRAPPAKEPGRAKSAANSHSARRNKKRDDLSIIAFLSLLCCSHLVSRGTPPTPDEDDCGNAEPNAVPPALMVMRARRFASGIQQSSRSKTTTTSV